jgi:hypothetical protein
MLLLVVCEDLLELLFFLLFDLGLLTIDHCLLLNLFLLMRDLLRHFILDGCLLGLLLDDLIIHELALFINFLNEGLILSAELCVF